MDRKESILVLGSCGYRNAYALVQVLSPFLRHQPRKAHLNCRSKTGKGRTVPLEKGLALELKSRRDRNIGKRLVFGTDKNKEDRHWHRYCKKAAKNSGMDEKNFWVHKFRDTMQHGLAVQGRLT